MITGFKRDKNNQYIEFEFIRNCYFLLDALSMVKEICHNYHKIRGFFRLKEENKRRSKK